MVAERLGLVLDNVDRAALGAAQTGDETTGCSGECLDGKNVRQGRKRNNVSAWLLVELAVAPARRWQLQQLERLLLQ